MSKKTIIEGEDVAELYDVAFRQAQEDRDAILDAYNDLAQHLSGSLHAYAASGDTLAKFAELRIKQNNQILELLKVAQKAQPEEDHLTADDYANIAEAIEKSGKDEDEE